MSDDDKTIFWNGDWYSWNDLRANEALVAEMVAALSQISPDAVDRLMAGIEGGP